MEASSTSPTVLFATEGPTDAPVAEALIRATGAIPSQVHASGGKSALDARLRRWNQPSNVQRLLVLRDWDRDDGADCVPELLQKLLPNGLLARRLALRIAVRATESWLLADADACERFFEIRGVAKDPEALEDPKRSLVDLCRRSRSRSIRDRMVPGSRAGRRVGPEYEALVIEFATERWDLDRACSRAPSLERARQAVRRLVEAAPPPG